MLLIITGPQNEYRPRDHRGVNNHMTSKMMTGWYHREINSMCMGGTHLLYFKFLSLLNDNKI